MYWMPPLCCGPFLNSSSCTKEGMELEPDFYSLSLSIPTLQHLGLLITLHVCQPIPHPSALPEVHPLICEGMWRHHDTVDKVTYHYKNCILRNSSTIQCLCVGTIEVWTLETRRYELKSERVTQSSLWGTAELDVAEPPWGFGIYSDRHRNNWMLYARKWCNQIFKENLKRKSYCYLEYSMGGRVTEMIPCEFSSQFTVQWSN